MIRRLGITDEQARLAIREGEFPRDVTASSDSVAVILTQGWCPDWRRMDRWLSESLERDGEAQNSGASDSVSFREANGHAAAAHDIHIYQLIYDRVAFFDEFRGFKERVLGNYLIPYVRYYRHGEFVGDSNQVSEQEFFRRLTG